MAVAVDCAIGSLYLPKILLIITVSAAPLMLTPPRGGLVGDRFVIELENLTVPNAVEVDAQTFE